MLASFPLVLKNIVVYLWLPKAVEVFSINTVSQPRLQTGGQESDEAKFPKPAQHLQLPEHQLPPPGPSGADPTGRGGAYDSPVSFLGEDLFQTHPQTPASPNRNEFAADIFEETLIVPATGVTPAAFLQDSGDFQFLTRDPLWEAQQTAFSRSRVVGRALGWDWDFHFIDGLTLPRYHM